MTSHVLYSLLSFHSLISPLQAVFPKDSAVEDPLNVPVPPCELERKMLKESSSYSFVLAAFLLIYSIPMLLFCYLSHINPTEKLKKGLAK